MSNFREIAIRKNFKLLKYEQIIYHFKARDLEIVSRHILISRKYKQKQISRNSLNCS